jgi:hypothetical protein
MLATLADPGEYGQMKQAITAMAIDATKTTQAMNATR